MGLPLLARADATERRYYMPALQYTASIAFTWLISYYNRYNVSAWNYTVELETGPYSNSGR